VGLAGLEPAPSSFSGIDGQALCYPAFSLVVLVRKSFKDGVNSLSPADRGRTRLPDQVATQAPGFTRANSATNGSRPPLGPPNASVHTGADGCWVGLLGQVLGHQEAAQVIRARAAWPLRLGWKKSKVLTWLAVNW
jgi:hypothetical protein